MKKIILIFLLLFISVEVFFAQDFKGIVISKNTQKPVSGCLVIVKGTTINSITDEKGNFSISFPSGKQNNSFVFTILGYNTAEYDLSSYKKDTFYITQKEIQLKEVTVSSNKKNILNPKNAESILDFDLLNDNLVILIAGTSKNNLRLMDETGTVLSNLKVDRHSETLMHDCIGNLHLISTDTAWQVFYNYISLNILKSYPKSLFESVLGNCVCMNNKNYYFQNKTYRNLRTDYFYYNENEKGVKHDLVKFQDSSKIKSFETDYSLEYFLDIRRQSHNTMYSEPVDSIIKHLEQYRTELPLDWKYRCWLGEVETQMIKIDSNSFIINFTDSTIYSVAKNNEVKYLSKLPGLKNKKILSKIYVDDDYMETYLIAFAENKLTFIKIDLTTGKELSQTAILNMPFLPKKIIINSGSAYFIQKNLADEQSYKIIKYYLN
ncbi:MAG: carboxypeptidase-like regulatory domain-containing protein [Bacteroidia bacterium]